MKLFAAYIAVAVAQEDDAERKKTNSYNPPPAPYSGGNNYNGGGSNYNGGGSNYNGGGGSSYGAYGDPHFMVHTEGQDPVCFDFTPVADSEMNLLIDPTSALAITAHATYTEEDEKTRMTTIHFSSPNGAHLAFSLDGVHHSGIGEEGPTEPDALTGVQSYGDINFIVHHNESGEHQSTKIYINNGPIFTVKISGHHGGLNFAVNDHTGISDRSRGILGGFIRPNAYYVEPLNTMTEDDAPEGNVVINKYAVSATKGAFHKSEDCWVVDDDEVTHMLANL